MPNRKKQHEERQSRKQARLLKDAQARRELAGSRNGTISISNTIGYAIQPPTPSIRHQSDWDDGYLDESSGGHNSIDEKLPSSYYQNVSTMAARVQKYLGHLQNTELDDDSELVDPGKYILQSSVYRQHTPPLMQQAILATVEILQSQDREARKKTVEKSLPALYELVEMWQNSSYMSTAQAATDNYIARLPMKEILAIDAVRSKTPTKQKKEHVPYNSAQVSLPQLVINSRLLEEVFDNHNAATQKPVANNGANGNQLVLMQSNGAFLVVGKPEIVQPLEELLHQNDVFVYAETFGGYRALSQVTQHIPLVCSKGYKIVDTSIWTASDTLRTCLQPDSASYAGDSMSISTYIKNVKHLLK